MTRRLLIFLGDRLTAPISWGLVDGAQLIEAGRLFSADGLKSLQPQQESAETVVAFLPGETAALRRMETPPKAAAKFKAAAAYMLEDALSEPIEMMHYVTQTLTAGGIVLAINDGLMATWRDAFDDAGLEVDSLTTDAAALVDISDGVIIIRDGARTIVGATDTAFACDNDLFDIVAPELLPDIAGRNIQCLGEDADLPAFVNDGEIDWLGPFDDARRFEFYAAALNVGTPINLLQGDYRRKMQWRAGLSIWRNAGVIAAGLAVMALGSVVADAVKQERMGERWAKLTSELHIASFPDAAETDPLAHARSVLATGADAASFLVLSTRFSEALTRNENVQIDRIGFDSAQGRFTVSIRGQSDAAIEALRLDLTKMGVTVRDNGGYRQSQGQRVGELLVEIS